MSDYQKLSFENIAIVADGQRGEKGDQGDQGETGASTFKSTVFKRYIPTAEKPVPDSPGTIGSYYEPVPTSLGWSDGIPSGTDPIFSCYRNFGINGGKSDSSWSIPTLMADTSDFDVEYCTKETYNSGPTGHPNTNTSEWSNTPSSNAIWMATSSMKNGSWTDWTISRIKGEKGEKGDKGDPGNGVTQEQVNEIERLVKEAVLEDAQKKIDAASADLTSKLSTAESN